jgi:hypothetical protein
MRRWLWSCQEAHRLAKADAERLICDHGGAAYWEARRRERDLIRSEGITHRAGQAHAHWRRVALIIALMTDKRVGLDTATRMLARDDE